MKQILTSLLILFKISVCGQTFTVTNDTLDLLIKNLIKPATKVELTHAVKFQEKYFCFLNEVKKVNTLPDLKVCFIISSDGKSLQKVEVPTEIQKTVYYDLFLRHDTVFVKTYLDSKTYYFSTDKSKWIKTKEADDMIYEDERFYFTYLDFGEWGSTTWCKDKQTKIEYEVASSGTIINKIDNAYYITAALKVIKIENPLKLKQCDKNYYYEIVRQNHHSEGTNSLLGTEVLIEDTTYSYWEQKEPKLYITSSFLADNKLYHLCNDSTTTFIAELKNGSMVPIQIIGKKLSTFDWHYSNRNKLQKDNSQLLKFRTQNGFGLIEVKGKDIRIHNFHLK